MGQGSSEAHLQVTGRKCQREPHDHAHFVGESNLFKLYLSVFCLPQGTYFIRSLRETVN